MNGNVPCHVPDVLRGGKEDNHPSGIFNTYNGRLRDFATGVNHLFLNTGSGGSLHPRRLTREHLVGCLCSFWLEVDRQVPLLTVVSVIRLD